MKKIYLLILAFIILIFGMLFYSSNFEKIEFAIVDGAIPFDGIQEYLKSDSYEIYGTNYRNISDKSVLYEFLLIDEGQYLPIEALKESTLKDGYKFDFNREKVIIKSQKERTP